MRIVVWGINYAPELTGIAVYNTSFCQYLRRQGHDVEMVSTFAYYPVWKKSPADHSRLYRRDVVDGVPVHRCWHYVPQRPAVWSRILHEATFVCGSFLRIMTLRRPDVLVVVSPPLLLGLMARLTGLLRGIPYWFHVQDLQPDAALRLGMVKPGPTAEVLLWLEQKAYRGAARVSAISRSLVRTLREKGVPETRSLYWPNWITAVPSQPPERETARQQLGFAPTQHLVSYAGNLGIKQGLDVLIEAAQHLSAREDITFVIAGDGSDRPRLEALAARHELKNIRFLGVLSEEEHTALLCASNVCVITQRHGTGTAFLPSKLLKILALGRAVLTNADPGSVLYEAVEAGGFGLSVASEDHVVLADDIEKLIRNPTFRTACEERARSYVLQFAEEGVLSGIERELQVVAQRGNT